MSKKKILVYSHSVDNDGFFSAALVRYFCEVLYPDCEITIKGWTYSRDQPKLEKLLGYDVLYLTDLHWDNALMVSLYEEYKENFIWIDHHKSSINEFYEYFYDSSKVDPQVSFLDPERQQPKRINGIQTSEYSACRNVWKWFRFLTSCKESFKCHLYELIDFQKKHDASLNRFGLNDSDKDLPLWLYMVSTYDNWNRREDTEFWDNILWPFEMYMRNTVHNAEEAYAYIISWIDKMIDPFGECSISYYNSKEVFTHLSKGKTLMKFQQDKYDRDCKVSGYTKKVLTDDGRELKCFLLNTQDRGSTIFKNIPEVDTYDMLIPFYRDKDKWNYSAYSLKEDIYIPGVYIKGIKFNGHAKAAGTQSPLDNFLFE